MRVILSRKGFDSKNGGIASPILPDGTLLSLPIPEASGETTYHDIGYNGKSYYEIIQELSPARAKRLKSSKCHVDPDLSCRYLKDMPNWKPAFGQCNQALSHLDAHSIGCGDIFLFYGWFRRTEYDKNGHLHFVSPQKDTTPDRHIIFGYMEIEEKITNVDRIRQEFPYHPHSLPKHMAKNALYAPKSTLSLNDSIKGWGTLNDAPVRQLTMNGHSRSDWALPDWFRNAKISYHDNPSYGWLDENDYFRAASIGQEFVIETDKTQEMEKWLLQVIADS